MIERSKELKNKDGDIAKLEKAIEERSHKIASLQGEIASLQVCNLLCSSNYFLHSVVQLRNNYNLLPIHVQAQGSIAAEEQAGKANARAVELEKQVQKYRS
jgi:predicted RNase H-like nuclease (RuvC/YqgF family)